jgi:hypothetical protein
MYDGLQRPDGMWTYGNFRGSGYDLDHTDMPNLGIVEDQWEWKPENGGAFVEGKLPTDLTYKNDAGEDINYIVKYSVKDIEGAWSLPVYTTVGLFDKLPVILDASLKTESNNFSLSSIPITENLQVYDIETKYPNPVRLELGIFKDGTLQGSKMSISFDGSNGTQNGDSINWNDLIFEVDSSIPDGLYTFRITAFNSSDASKFAFKEFSVNVFTPINLVPNVPDSLIVGSDNLITATTSKYVDQLTMTIFNGTSYEKKLSMSKDGSNTWEYNYIPDGTEPDGSYQIEFIASIPTVPRKSETSLVPFELISLNIEDVRIWGDWNHWRGQVDKISGLTLATNPHRFMSHENINIEADIVGVPDLVTIELSPELKALVYRNTEGHTYRHDFDFGLPAETFPLSMQTSNQYNYSRDYILPLADWTLDYENNRHRGQYWITVTATKGTTTRSVTINDIELTGNIHDMIYYQPEE